MTDLRQAAQQGLRALKASRLALLHPDSIAVADAAIAALEAALEQPEPKPVAWARETDECLLPSDAISWVKTHLHTLPLYTHPQRREWRGLTDGEREQATGWSVEHIEAALRERNT